MFQDQIEGLFQDYMLVTGNFTEAAATLTLAHVIAALVEAEPEPEPVGVNVNVTGENVTLE